MSKDLKTLDFKEEFKKLKCEYCDLSAFKIMDYKDYLEAWLFEIEYWYCSDECYLKDCKRVKKA